MPSRPSGNNTAFPFPTASEIEARHKVCNDSLQPWTYLLTIPGKNVRDLLITAFNNWIFCDENQLITIKQLVAYLHSASLIVDDIEDESETRRGFPAAHIKFGIAPSLNAANYVYFLAMEKLLILQSPKAVEAFTAEMLNLHRGQGRDIFWRTSSYIASEAEYIQMVQDKTGGLFRLAIRVMTAVSTSSGLQKNDSMFELDVEDDKDVLPIKRRVNHEDLLSLANDLASFFQIRDDLINLASPSFHKKKGFCEDITEGKLSFIALHSLRALKGTKRFQELLNILQMKTLDHDVIKRALLMMDDTGSFSYCLKYLDDLQARIEQSINKLGGNKLLSEVLDTLAKDLDDCRNIHRVIESKN